jgi:regulator of replication initiation timing
MMNNETKRDRSTFVTLGSKAVTVIDIISSWAVNTFYNYLHEQAVSIHASGRAESITDAYKLTVQWYLTSLNKSEGYRRILMALYKYYSDYSRFKTTSFDAWVKDVLQQFIPSDYFGIMSNVQQDVTMRNILVNSLSRLSSDIVCTKLIDLLITNHGDPSLIPTMKSHMKDALLHERHRIFESIFKSSVGTEKDDKPTDAMKRELRALVEKNVILEHKNATLTDNLKRAIAVVKSRDEAISRLTSELNRARKQVVMPVDSFISSVERSTGLRVADAKQSAMINESKKILPAIESASPPLTHIEDAPDDHALPNVTSPIANSEQSTSPGPILASHRPSETLSMDMSEFLMQ